MSSSNGSNADSSPAKESATVQQTPTTKTTTPIGKGANGTTEPVDIPAVNKRLRFSYDDNGPTLDSQQQQQQQQPDHDDEDIQEPEASTTWKDDEDSATNVVAISCADAGATTSQISLLVQDKIQPESNSSPMEIEWISDQTARIQFSSQQSCQFLISGCGYLTCRKGKNYLHVNGYKLPHHERIPFHVAALGDPCLTVTSLNSHRTRNQGEDGTILEVDSMFQQPLQPNITQQQGPCLRTSFSIHRMDEKDSKGNLFSPTLLPSAWKQAADEILEDCTQFSQQQQQSLLVENNSNGQDTENHPSPPFVVAICGAKGVGKSTFLRYLLHCCLSRENDPETLGTPPPPPPPPVAILDADLGQPELGPPGLLTLTYPITKPILSPPHRHMVNSYRHPNIFLPGDTRHLQQWAQFLGCVSVAETDPFAYQQALATLYQKYCQENQGRGILLVNLHGWIKGLGGPLLQALIQQTFHTNHAIVIQGTTASQQVDLDLLTGGHTRIHVVDSYKESEAQSSRETQRSFPKPSALRTRRFYSYFLSQEQEDNLDNHDLDKWKIPHELAAMPPYVVPMEAVTLIDPAVSMASNTTPEAVYYSWNATIVGLCCAENYGNGIDPKSVPWYLLPCVGLGLIRSVHVPERLLYILTPVDPVILSSKVNVLVKSRMGIPSEMMFGGVQSECFPYLNMTVPFPLDAPLLLGTTPIKSRNTIARRSFYQAQNSNTE